MARRRISPTYIHNDQKCWRCALATGLPSKKTGRPCPHTQTGEDYAPVPGWEATAKRRRVGLQWEIGWDLRSEDYCPLFEQDDPTKYKADYPEIEIWKQ